MTHLRRIALGVMTLLLAPPLLSGQRSAEPGPTLGRLLSQLQPGDSGAVHAFWDSIAARGTPIVDRIPHDSSRILAGFVYRGADARNVILENGVNGWTYVLNQLERVPGTDIWHITVAVPSDIRLGYVFRENDNLIPLYLDPAGSARRWAANRPDPFNPVVDSSQNRRSVLLGPLAEPDIWSARRSGVPAGALEELTIRSGAYSKDRRVTVYTPPMVRTDGLPLLVVFDGGVYQRVIRLPTILDNLLSERAIRPVVTVFVTQENRNAELLPNEAFSAYVVDELIPFLRMRYRLSRDPLETITLGSSHGGLAANWLALSRPEVIGSVISQSASLFWSPDHDPEPEYLARYVARRPQTSVRFWLEAGRFEIDRTQGGAPGQAEVSRHFRDVLQARGNRVEYSEFPGGHEYQSWRITTPKALVHFLGKR